VKAIVHYMYGSPEMLELREIDPPVPKLKREQGGACFATRIGTRPVRNE
jgi:hypothetical protein